jgi:hypothetical protein
MYNKGGPSYPIFTVDVILPTNKRYPGITGDNPLEILSRDCLALDVGSSHLRLKRVSRVGCSPIKVVRELGLERVRQFGPIYYFIKLTKCSVSTKGLVGQFSCFGAVLKHAFGYELFYNY